MMIHPGPFDIAAPVMIAAAHFDVAYHGKEAHAAAFANLGINAADAMVIAQVAIGLLRQHLEDTDRIPASCELPVPPRTLSQPTRLPHTSFEPLPSNNLSGSRGVQFGVFHAGAVGAEAQLEVTGRNKPYAEVRDDPVLSRMYAENAAQIGRRFTNGETLTAVSGSTDMGDLPKVVPSIHPFIGIDCLPATYHKAGFTEACVTAQADQPAIDGSVGFAWTAIDSSLAGLACMPTRQGLGRVQVQFEAAEGFREVSRPS